MKKTNHIQIISKFLKKHGMSEADFARHIGCSRSLVSHMLAGRRKPGADTCIEIIEFMANHGTFTSLRELRGL